MKLHTNHRCDPKAVSPEFIAEFNRYQNQSQRRRRASRFSPEFPCDKRKNIDDVFCDNPDCGTCGDTLSLF